MRRAIISLIFTVYASVAAAQGCPVGSTCETFTNFMSGLPLATVPVGSDMFYLLQSGTSKRASWTTVLGGVTGVANTWTALQNFSGGAIAPNLKVKLTADITFYVNPSAVMTATCGAFTCSAGSDSNNGLAITTPFLTLQKAVDVVADGYDLAGHTVFIQGSHGTYAPAPGVNVILTAKGFIGANGVTSVQILCSATPSDCLLSTTSADVVSLGAAAAGAGSTGLTQLTIGGFKATTTTGGNVFNVAGGGIGLQVGITGFPIDFGTTVQDHIIAGHNAWVIAGTNNLVSGGALIHAAAQSNAVVALHNTTETFSNTPAFTFYAYSETGASLFVDGMTFTNGGTVTGTRYFANLLGVIYACPVVSGTCSPASTYLPGNSAGVALNGGIYLAGPDASVFSMSSLVATGAAAVVGAGVAYGGTTVAAGSGTCPTGTVGGQTVLGCIVVNVAGTSRNVPFF